MHCSPIGCSLDILLTDNGNCLRSVVWPGSDKILRRWRKHFEGVSNVISFSDQGAPDHIEQLHYGMSYLSFLTGMKSWELLGNLRWVGLVA